MCECSAGMTLSILPICEKLCLGSSPVTVTQMYTASTQLSFKSCICLNLIRLCSFTFSSVVLMLQTCSLLTSKIMYFAYIHVTTPSLVHYICTVAIKKHVLKH